MLPYATSTVDTVAAFGQKTTENDRKGFPPNLLPWTAPCRVQAMSSCDRPGLNLMESPFCRAGEPMRSTRSHFWNSSAKSCRFLIPQLNISKQYQCREPCFAWLIGHLSRGPEIISLRSITAAKKTGNTTTPKAAVVFSHSHFFHCPYCPYCHCPYSSHKCFHGFDPTSQVYTSKYQVIHVKKLKATMLGTKIRATESATRCTGARFSWAVSTRLMIWLSIVSLPNFSLEHLGTVVRIVHMGSPLIHKIWKTKQIGFDSGMILMKKKLVQLDPLLRRMIVNLMFAPTGAYPSLLC